MQVYTIKAAITPGYNNNDFTSISWLSIAELQERIKQGEKTKIII